MRRELAVVLLAALALPGGAVENTQWPPRDEVAARMRELQAVITSAEASTAERDAARGELSRLLKSPNAVGRTPDEKPVNAAPARAAIEPFGSVARQMPNPKIVQPDVATVEVIEPPRIAVPRVAVTPSTGRPVIPSTGAAVDPRTGHILHETPNGYIDPRTGAFTPK
jgi:hypothetical protein